MAQGKPPFYNLGEIDILRKIQFEESPSLKDQSKWGKLFINFIKACLTKNPHNRPSASQLLKDHSELFQQTQPPEYLISTLLHGVPNVLERVSRTF